LGELVSLGFGGEIVDSEEEGWGDEVRGVGERDRCEGGGEEVEGWDLEEGFEGY